MSSDDKDPVMNQSGFIEPRIRIFRRCSLKWCFFRKFGTCTFGKLGSCNELRTVDAKGVVGSRQDMPR